jgi:hypothetical protein
MAPPTQVARGADHDAVPRQPLLHLGPQQRVGGVPRRQPAEPPRQVLRVREHLEEAAARLDAAAHRQLAVELEQQPRRRAPAQQLRRQQQRRRGGRELRQRQQRRLDGAVGRLGGEERADERGQRGPARARRLQLLPAQGELLQAPGRQVRPRRGVDPGQRPAAGQPEGHVVVAWLH